MMVYPYLAMLCDDAMADRLEADGWTIERGALAHTHHGFYRPHIATRWLPDRASDAGSAPVDLPAEAGAAPAPLVPPEDLARALACRARGSSCPIPQYCPPACRRWA
jgi:hypothetical protein